jgi:hypothetical protein
LILSIRNIYQNKKKDNNSTKLVPKKHIVTFACKFTLIKRKEGHVVKPAITTKVITKIISAADPVDEVIAGAHCSFGRKNKGRT